MKKIYYLAALAILGLGLSACSSGEKSQTSLEKEKIAGKVKQISVQQHVAIVDEDGNIRKDTANVETETKSVFYYDENGNNSKTEILTQTGESLGSQTCTYDDRNNPIEIVVENPYLRSKITQQFTYDKKNRVQKMVYLNTDGEIEAIETDFYDDDYTQRVEYKDADGNLLSNYVNKLDENGNVIDNKWFSDSTASSHYSAVFDENGNRTELVVYNPQDSVENRFVSSYDEKGNMIDQMGYDKFGNLIFGYSYQYVNDSVGNWVVCTELMLDSTGSLRPVTIMEREILYYE